MFEARIENTKGSILTLTNNESKFQLISITGLNPPKAQINVSTIAGLDGAKFNSAKLETRNVVINLKINGDVEENRQFLYTFCPTKEWCKFYFRNANRNVFIECYVESNECDLFTNNEIMQISLICPYPYFKDMQQIVDDISKVLSAFEFPFAIGSKGATNPFALIDEDTDDAVPISIIDSARIANVYNSSESETGFIIEIDIYDIVHSIQIVNTITGKNLTLKYDFEINDKVIINTNKSQKAITLLRNGKNSNLFPALQKGSTFFQLSLGDNFFGYTVDNSDNDSSVHILFKHNNTYRGV